MSDDKVHEIMILPGHVHSPLPWHLDDWKNGHAGIVTFDDRELCDEQGAILLGNAELIVAAVNSHNGLSVAYDRLLEALDVLQAIRADAAASPWHAAIDGVLSRLNT